MLKCMIVDDEQPSINILTGYIKRIPGLELVATATDPIKGIELLRNHPVDVLFLDIQMDEMTGIEVKKAIDKHIKVIFCTAYSEFAVTSYELDAVDYLVKPIGFNRFVKAVKRISDKVLPEVNINEAITDDYFYVKAEHKGKMVKIDLVDIDYIEARNNYVAFHRGKDVTMAYLTMRELEKRLPASQFARVHKSYIVAINRISELENGSLLLKQGAVQIPLGDSYKSLFLERMKGKFI